MSISTLFVNLCSGMSSKKSVDTDTDFLSFCILACDWNLSIISESACTANCQDSLFFRVNINKLLSFKYGQVNILCSTHSNLFIYRKHSLNWWMRNILAVQNRQCHSNCNTVITAKCSIFCFYISVFYIQFKRIFLKIMI